MMLALIAATSLPRRWRLPGGVAAPPALLLLAVVPAVGFGWAVAMTGRVHDGVAVEQQIRWVDELGLELSFRLTTLTWVMMLLVTGVGALVLAYCAAYFRRDDGGPGAVRGAADGVRGRACSGWC